MIRARAYELYEEGGREDGRDLEDWLQAEAEVTKGQKYGGLSIGVFADRFDASTAVSWLSAVFVPKCANSADRYVLLLPQAEIPVPLMGTVWPEACLKPVGYLTAMTAVT